MNNDKNYTDLAQEVIDAEKLHIKNEQENEKLYGLAISGGGIRSASFGLGVLQALVSEKVDLLRKIHYMSTVSGGGYIGSSLTWFLKNGLPDDSPAGTTIKDFPFGTKDFGARNCEVEDKKESTENETEKSGDKKNVSKNAILDFIRQHGNYLTPGKGLDAISLFGVVIRSTFVSLLVYFSLLTLLMTLLEWAGAFTPLKLIQINGNVLFTLPFDQNILLIIAILVIAIILISSIIYSIATFLNSSYPLLVFSQKGVGWMWTLVFLLIVLGIVPLIVGIADSQISASASASGIGGIILGLYESFRTRKPKEKEGPMSKFRILLGAAALIYSLLILSYLAANKLGNSHVLWILIPVSIVCIVGFGVNLNVFGLHRMYRDRLMETFMANKDNITKNEWGKATDANGSLIETMCDKNNLRPYHIINTNIVTTDSSHAKYNGRGGDNFILSPLYCGSDATGWQKTNKYRKYRFGNNGITLATAMAISGAAINPSAGPNGQGLTKNKLISILLGLLNIQLGFWSDNPNPKKLPKFKLPSNFLFPGLFGNILGRNLDETKPSVLLTDGGHFENLGLYELIRRRLDVIIVSDAGADSDFNFDDLTNLMEKVRVDFGTNIKFHEEVSPGKSYPLKGLIPDKEDGSMGSKLKLADRGFAMANIYYSGYDEESNDQKNKGLLIYIKTTLTDKLPPDLYGYKFSNPTYPDETTADQFFSELQFEAYRELGFRLAKSVDWDLVK